MLGFLNVFFLCINLTLEFTSDMMTHVNVRIVLICSYHSFRCTPYFEFILALQIDGSPGDCGKTSED